MSRWLMSRMDGSSCGIDQDQQDDEEHEARFSAAFELSYAVLINSQSPKTSEDGAEDKVRFWFCKVLIPLDARLRSHRMNGRIAALKDIVRCGLGFTFAAVLLKIHGFAGLESMRLVG